MPDPEPLPPADKNIKEATLDWLQKAEDHEQKVKIDPLLVPETPAAAEMVDEDDDPPSLRVPISEYQLSYVDVVTPNESPRSQASDLSADVFQNFFQGTVDAMTATTEAINKAVNSPMPDIDTDGSWNRKKARAFKLAAIRQKASSATKIQSVQRGKRTRRASAAEAMRQARADLIQKCEMIAEGPSERKVARRLFGPEFDQRVVADDLPVLPPNSQAWYIAAVLVVLFVYLCSGLYLRAQSVAVEVREGVPKGVLNLVAAGLSRDSTRRVALAGSAAAPLAFRWLGLAVRAGAAGAGTPAATQALLGVASAAAPQARLTSLVASAALALGGMAAKAAHPAARVAVGMAAPASRLGVSATLAGSAAMARAKLVAAAPRLARSLLGGVAGAVVSFL